MSVVLTRHDKGVLHVVLARSEKRNAINPEMIAGLTEALQLVGDARLVVLTGEGRSFSSGADLEWMRASGNLEPDENLAEARRLLALLNAIDGCPVPVVAGVQGRVAGAACGLTACCDVAIAHRESTFAFSEVTIGLVPAVISPFVVARIGHGAARRPFVTGESFTAETALRIGLVDEITDDVAGRLEEVTARILAAAPGAVRIAKRLARETIEADETVQIIADRRASDEAQRLIRTFLDDRATRNSMA